MKGPARLSDLASVLERVRAVAGKNEKVEILGDFLAGLSPADSELAARMATGRVSERGSKDEVQLGYSSIIGVLEEVCGARPRQVSEVYLRHGDLGDVAEELLRSKKETTLFPEALTLEDLGAAFARMRAAKGKGSSAARRSSLKALLLRATPLEGKYLVKMLTGEMRTGVVTGLMEAAVARANSVSEESVAKAHLLLGDVGLLARTAAEGRLGDVKLTPFRPVNFMLAEPMATAEEIAEHFGKQVYAEYKYDGVRAQVHKRGGEARVYSRRLEEITASFPEVQRAAAEIDGEFVMDGEIVPFRDGAPLAFQLLQRRLRRVENFEEAARAAPVKYFAFDLILLDGEELYGRPLSERSAALEALIRGSGVQRADMTQVKTARQVARLFAKSRSLGYEGLVVKDPASAYTMGRRGNSWVKLKEELDTVDAVIVAAEYGHGKRAGVISDYTFAVRSGGGLKTIGKAYSGLTDQEIAEMTERLKKITVKDYGYRRTVRPEVVIEVAFDSIQRSERHDSGYALRFPRIKRIRDDKSPADADTIEKVESIFRSQRVKAEEA